MKTLWKKWGLALLLACMTFALPSSSALYAAEDEEYEDEYGDDDYSEDDYDDDDYDDDDYDEDDYDEDDYDEEYDEDEESGSEFYIDLDFPFWDFGGIYALPGEDISLTATLMLDDEEAMMKGITFDWFCEDLDISITGSRNEKLKITKTKNKASSKPYKLDVTVLDEGDVWFSMETDVYITECNPTLSVISWETKTKAELNKLEIGKYYLIPIHGANWQWDTRKNKKHNFYELVVTAPDGSKTTVTTGIAGDDIPNPGFSGDREGTYTLQAVLYREDKVFRKSPKVTVKVNGLETTKDNMVYRLTGMDSKTKKGTAVLVKSLKKKTSLKKLTVPDTVKLIYPDDKEQQYTCKVTGIEAKAFKGYKKLKTLTIGKNVTKIGKSAFQGCKVLKKAVIGKNVKEIGVSAFQDCKKLENITIKGKKLKKVGKNAVKKIYKKAKIKVPKSKKKAYKKLFKSKTGFKKTMKIK